MTLAEVVAKVDGLLNDCAEPKALFLYRKESRETAHCLGIDVSKYDGRGYTTASAVTSNVRIVPVSDSKYAVVGHAIADYRDEVPVIYSLNLRDPQGYFTATQVEMKNKDVILVSNAATVDFTKFRQLLRIGVAKVRETHAGGVEIN